MSDQQTKEKPMIKIGHYVLGETLGVGTFGKVKSKFIPKNKTSNLKNSVSSFSFFSFPAFMHVFFVKL